MNPPKKIGRLKAVLLFVGTLAIFSALWNTASSLDIGKEVQTYDSTSMLHVTNEKKELYQEPQHSQPASSSSPKEHKDPPEGAAPLSFEEWKTEAIAACEQTLQEIGDGYDSQAAVDSMTKSIDRSTSRFLKQPDLINLKKHLPSSGDPVACQHAFFDFGSNIGDGIGYFMDAAMDVCSPLWIAQLNSTDSPMDRFHPLLPRPRLNVSTLAFSSEGSPNLVVGANPTYRFLVQEMENHHLEANQLCVFGVEGNPRFTKTLQRLQSFLTALQPQFFQHLHIHTETVLTKENGPVLLYLDDVSTGHNFWGSSILQTLAEVQETAAQQNAGELLSVNVTGISLSTLLEQSMMPFLSSATTETNLSGGSVLIKMDIEGAEYEVLKEIAKSGVLCDYVGQDLRDKSSRQNEAVLLVEFHGKKVISEDELLRIKPGIKKARATLEECGVKFVDMSPGWS